MTAEGGHYARTGQPPSNRQGGQYWTESGLGGRSTRKRSKAIERRRRPSPESVKHRTGSARVSFWQCLCLYAFALRCFWQNFTPSSSVPRLKRREPDGLLGPAPEGRSSPRFAFFSISVGTGPQRGPVLGPNGVGGKTAKNVFSRVQAERLTRAYFQKERQNCDSHKIMRASESFKIKKIAGLRFSSFKKIACLRTNGRLNRTESGFAFRSERPSHHF